MSFFSKGFATYFENGQFADTTLIVGGREFKVHRIILVYSSGYFAEKLVENSTVATNGNTESGTASMFVVYMLVCLFVALGLGCFVISSVLL